MEKRVLNYNIYSYEPQCAFLIHIYIYSQKHGRNLELSERGLQSTFDGGIESSAVFIEGVHMLWGGSSRRDEGLANTGEGVRETLPQSLGMAGGVGIGNLLSQLLALTGRGEGER